MLLEDRLKKYLKKNIKYVQMYFILMFVGCVCHGYMFFNKLPNFDDAVALQSKGTTFSAGRWFLPVTSVITNGISIPVIVGVFSLSCIILSAFIICDLFQIGGRINVFIVGCLMIIFPTVAGTFTFMFTADSYMLGLLLSVVSVWIAIRKENYTRGGVLIAISLGIYQAYYDVVVVLIWIYLMVCYIKVDKKIFARRFFKLSILLGYSMVLYLIIDKICLWITKTETEQPTVLQLIKNIPNAMALSYENFLMPIFKDFCGITYNLPLQMLYCSAVVLSVILYVKALIQYKKSIWVGILMIALFPIALNFICFAMLTRKMDTLMIYSFVFVWIVPILFYNLYGKKDKLGEVVMVGCLIFTCWQYMLQSNRAYLNMDMAKHQAISYYSTLITQIKSVEGYSSDLPVALIGKESEDNSVNISNFYEGDIRGTMTLRRFINMYSRHYFMAYYCGYSPQWYADVAMLEKKNEVQRMPCYPSTGSIIIDKDGVVIVKIGETE